MDRLDDCDICRRILVRIIGGILHAARFGYGYRDDGKTCNRICEEKCTYLEFSIVSF